MKVDIEKEKSGVGLFLCKYKGYWQFWLDMNYYWIVNIKFIEFSYSQKQTCLIITVKVFFELNYYAMIYI